MKTNTKQNSKSGLESRPEPFSISNRYRIDFIRRKANRLLETGKLLSLLQNEAPRFFELAEVVGNWIWIEFANKQPAAVTRILSELGFHWNKARKAWQHPCALFCEKASPVDPRKKYGSYFAADVKSSFSH